MEQTRMERMMQPVMRRYSMVMMMGFLIVLASFIIGTINSSTAAEYFAFSKQERETATAGSDLVNQKVFVERTKVWLPPFKFVGLGMMLGAITMALGTIAQRLRTMGETVMGTWPDRLRPEMPPKPMAAKMFPMMMMMGIVILFVALFVSLWLQGVAADYWNHAIATQLNPAQPGSELLNQLGTIQSVKAWLTPFKFVGMGFLFTGITLALVTIIGALRKQEETVGTFISQAESS
ncbi:MAG: hypothetical protein ACE5JP_11360 [Candidatus Bipolaricaulia bacterium]